ncbi:alpha/beta-hydrolase [Trematosphaeria pertusa]|uniref:Alpha/beta-hydrolase n=1 Tax=Trematosphaeria pertusa TaxID=390896 RepID=A0A6A6IAM1_9PLEO|nr:alpha/beta-hydrolase [Trematosphaeria pertusa]KAF2247615.1 alpha/beta-hydrolase [Trematosphaeria pertusa]
MPPSKPVLVFTPGGWHTPSSFKPTTSLLEKAGYTTVGVALPTIGPELRDLTPQQGWEDDVAAIRDELLKHVEAGSDVVLISHSYSGTVGSEACRELGKAYREAQGLPGGVTKLVYLAALLMDVGHYVWEASGGKPINEETTVVRGDLSYVDKVAAVPWFYNECSPEDQAKLAHGLQSQAWKAFMSKVEHAAWREIPGVYLMTEKDQAIPMAWQEAMLAEAKGHKFEIERCDGDHSPFVSRPEATARVIRKAAGEVM